MTNHPNRGWRARARCLAAEWAVSTTNSRPDTALLTRDEVAELLAIGYLQGYEAGRESTRPQRKEPPRG